MPRILIIDNHDSFVYNLVQLLREAKESCSYDLVLASCLGGDEVQDYDALLISPGPGLPTDQALMMQTLGTFALAGKPILGICLGCQAIAIHFGYQLRQLPEPLHGHTSLLQHKAQGILRTLPQDSPIARYHSWVVDMDSFVPTASNPQPMLVEEGYSLDRDGRQTMVIRHTTLPIWGLQFHPESIATQAGERYLHSWIELL